jgi:hypothetical protein
MKHHEITAILCYLHQFLIIGSSSDPSDPWITFADPGLSGPSNHLGSQGTALLWLLWLWQWHSPRIIEHFRHRFAF